VIVAKLALGDNFAQRIDYVFDGDGTDPERVLFAVANNLASEARAAAPEMDDTWAAQARLKKSAGVRSGGRRSVNPVLHDTLSWAEDEHPTIDEMIRASRSYFASQGLAEHEAVIVGHDHNGKRHVHIVANRIHPITGKVADRTDDQVKAQAWAHAYEVAQGKIRCRHRGAPKMDRAFALAATGKKKSGQRLSRAAHSKKQRQREANAEAKARHKAEKWTRLVGQQQSVTANTDRSLQLKVVNRSSTTPQRPAAPSLAHSALFTLP
jgi:hypothetical protein